MTNYEQALNKKLEEEIKAFLSLPNYTSLCMDNKGDRHRMAIAIRMFMKMVELEKSAQTHP